MGPAILEVQEAVSQLHRVTAAFNDQKRLIPSLDAMVSPSFITGVPYLLTSPWWPRLWVLEEATLAREAFFLCGPHTTPWKSLSSLVKQIKRLDLFHDFRSRGSVVLDGFDEILNIGIVRHTHSLTLTTDLVRSSRQRECLNPCDRVYGVMALMPSYVQDGFIRETGEKVEDLYPPFVKILLQLDTTATILSLLDSIQRHADLPSWCPDLHYRSLSTILAGHDGYHAGFTTNTMTEWDQDRNQDPRILKTKGIVIDAVDSVISGEWTDSEATDVDPDQENVNLLRAYSSATSALIPLTEMWRFFIGDLLGSNDSRIN